MRVHVPSRERLGPVRGIARGFAINLAAITLLLLFASAASPQGRGHGSDNEGGPPGKGHGQDQGQGQRAPQVDARTNVVIADRDRTVVRDYYRNEYARGNCPPGLAKKNNGCLPPGQANKAWAMGRPLPSGVVYYPLPEPLLGQMTPAPPGYQYVRVANDILLMAMGTRMIAGALADLGGY
jgi:hypothetical protein